MLFERFFFIVVVPIVPVPALGETTRLNFASHSGPFGLLRSMSVFVAFVLGIVDGVVVIGEYLTFAPVAGFVPGAAHVGVVAVVPLAFGPLP